MFKSEIIVNHGVDAHMLTLVGNSAVYAVWVSIFGVRVLQGPSGSLGIPGDGAGTQAAYTCLEAITCIQIIRGCEQGHAIIQHFYSYSACSQGIDTG